MLTYFQDVGFTGDYYEIRQNVYRADGTREGYNPQRWHGNSGYLNVQILDRFPCGGHIDVAVWRAGWFNSWAHVGGATIQAWMNDVPVQWMDMSDPNYFSGLLKYHWNACT